MAWNYDREVLIVRNMEQTTSAQNLDWGVRV